MSITSRTTPDIMRQMRDTFRSEALDLLIELDSSLLALESQPDASALVHRVFRAIHTIKGSGATAGLAHLARFAHNMEEAFDLAREGRLEVSPDLIDCGLKACDVIRLIIDQTDGEDRVTGEEEVTAAFASLLPPPAGAIQSTNAVPPSELRAAFEIIFRPHREMFYSGADPVTLLSDLRDLGQAHITAHTGQVPALHSLDAEHCYLWWEILLVTSRDEAAVRDVFVFVDGDADVQIRLREDQGAAVALFGSVSAETFEMFGAECEDHLTAIERDALLLEKDPASRASLNSLFRAVHSIKGNTGLLLGYVTGASLIPSHPLQILLRVSHAMESLLDPFRGADAGPIPGGMIQTALDTCDAIRSLLKRLAGDLVNRAGDAPVSPDLLHRLGVGINGTPVIPAAPGKSVDSRECAFLNTTSQCVEMIAGCFRHLENDGAASGPVLETYRRGVETWSAAAHYRDCPDLEAPLAQQLLILNAALQTGAALGDDQRASLSAAFHTACSVLDGLSSPERARLSAVAPVPDAPIDAPIIEQAADPAAANQGRRAEDSVSPATIRIDQNKLDRLMRVVGELLVARGAFPLLVQKLNNSADGVGIAGVARDLKEAGSNISRIADELQTSVMSIRMLPVKTVFQRFPRLVRDLARSLGKEVRLVMEGEAIDLDKTILEQIGDPLVHVIRNSVDHGIETPDERRAAGKDVCGQVLLRACREAGGVAIEVTDDGHGLDAGALKRKAVEKGLLTPEAAAAMSDESAFQLIFLPGLTTAVKVTDVSGRGVGMDVVRSNVRNLQGSVQLRSTPGKGTTLLIKLPTSLMISKGILLEAGAQEYILPLANIRDMVKVPLEEAHEYRGLKIAQVRGAIYPIFNLAETLGLTPANNPELSIAIVEAGTARYGLVVDRFLTEVEVLVKPLAGGLEQCKQFQGAAIMGDGRVVLVLNALECHDLDRTA